MRSFSSNTFLFLKVDTIVCIEKSSDLGKSMHKSFYPIDGGTTTPLRLLHELRSLKFSHFKIVEVVNRSCSHDIGSDLVAVGDTAETSSFGNSHLFFKNIFLSLV